MLCAIMIKIGPVTQEITRVTTTPFWTRQQKLAYLTEHFSNYYTDLHQLFYIGKHMYADYKLSGFAVAKGGLLR